MIYLILIFGFILLFIIIFVIYFLTGKIAYEKSFTKKAILAKAEEYKKIVDNPFLKMRNYQWINRQKFQKICIKNSNHETLNADFIDNKSEYYLIYSHGFVGHIYEEANVIAHIDNDIKMNYLFIHQRGHQGSDINYSTMGLNESKDLLEWIKYINLINSNAKIILYGMSMGAFTTLMAIGNNPKNVKCAICDCGFSSVYEQCKYVTSFNHKILSKILLIPGLALYFKLKFHLDIKKQNTGTSLSKTNIPVLIIHGTKDYSVPFKDSEINYSLIKNHNNSLFIPFKDVPHGLSSYYCFDRYYETLMKFVKISLGE